MKFIALTSAVFVGTLLRVVGSYQYPCQDGNYLVLANTAVDCFIARNNVAKPCSETECHNYCTTVGPMCGTTDPTISCAATATEVAVANFYYKECGDPVKFAVDPPESPEQDTTIAVPDFPTKSTTPEPETPPVAVNQDPTETGSHGKGGKKSKGTDDSEAPPVVGQPGTGSDSDPADAAKGKAMGKSKDHQSETTQFAVGQPADTTIASSTTDPSLAMGKGKGKSVATTPGAVGQPVVTSSAVPPQQSENSKGKSSKGKTSALLTTSGSESSQSAQNAGVVAVAASVGVACLAIAVALRRKRAKTQGYVSIQRVVSDTQKPQPSTNLLSSL